MQSLFDDVGDVKLPDEKPKRSYKKLFAILGIIVVAAGLGVGGYFGYQAIFPPKLTERPLPPSPEKLLAELKDARDQIDGSTRDIYQRIEQFNKRQSAIGRKPISFSQVFLQGLSPEEEQALDELVRQEKDPSYRGVLSQVVEDMKKIRDLQAKVSELEAKLPDEGIVAKAGDSHFKLAKQYLMEKQGLPESRAKELAERLNLMDMPLQKGFRVHFFYDPARDFFGTWVGQGDAKHTPLALMRAKEMHLIKERDTAVARAADLEEQKADLEETLAQLHKEVDALEVRKANLESSVAALESEKTKAEADAKETHAELTSRKNSMFYEADLADRLKARGVLRIFNKVEDIGDVKFDSSLDLS
ncbi:MAG TPA: hypothetical protein VNL37_03610, partial [Candidatus Polarisedimenticolia bacterium]|nr:hypothetical protein [Candidatus Polarisedimenticolia bacterium]